MSRSIYFLLFCLCASPIAAYSAEETQKEYEITVDKLQCLYEHTERLLSRSESSVTVQLHEQCEDIAIKVENIGATRGQKGEETFLAINIQENSDFDVLTLTRAELECFRDEFENLELEGKANPKEIISMHFAASCKIQSTS